MKKLISSNSDYSHCDRFYTSIMSDLKKVENMENRTKPEKMTKSLQGLVTIEIYNALIDKATKIIEK